MVVVTNCQMASISGNRRMGAKKLAVLLFSCTHLYLNIGNSSLDVALRFRSMLRIETPKRHHALLDDWDLVIKRTHSKV